MFIFWKFDILGLLGWRRHHNNTTTRHHDTETPDPGQPPSWGRNTSWGSPLWGPYSFRTQLYPSLSLFDHCWNKKLQKSNLSWIKFANITNYELASSYTLGPRARVSDLSCSPGVAALAKTSCRALCRSVVATPSSTFPLMRWALQFLSRQGVLRAFTQHANHQIKKNKNDKNLRNDIPAWTRRPELLRASHTP